MKPRSYKGWIALVAAGVASHVIMDFFPHWDYPARFSWGTIDLVLAIVVTLLIARRTGITWPVYIGALAAVAPDLDVVLVFLGVTDSSFFISHLPWFPHGQMGLPWGAIIQVAVVIVFFRLSLSLAGSSPGIRGPYGRG